MLTAGWWLAASQAWADKGDRVGRDAAETFGQTAPWVFTNGPFDSFNRSPASLDGPPSLDLDHYPLAGLDLATSGVPQSGAMSTNRDPEPNSDVGASFILIVLGVGVLISLRWRMSRSSQSDTGFPT